MDQPVSDISVSPLSPEETRPERPLRSERRILPRAHADALYRSLSDEERFALAQSIGACLLELLSAGRPAYLESLGVIFPVTAVMRRSYTMHGRIAVRQERVTTLDFEKCGELLPLHHERFGKIVESRELATMLHPLLPLALQLRWSLDEVRQCLTGFLRAARGEIITNGFSHRLEKIGIFYALHNRHGSTPDDWFAGADVFLVSGLRWVREAGAPSVYDRPELENPWELFAAAYGAAGTDLEIDVAKELAALPDFDASLLPPELRKISAKSFRIEDPGPKRGAPVLLFCTNGVRKIPLGTGEDAPRCELVFQLDLGAEEHAGAAVPHLPRRIFALAAAVIAAQLRGKNTAAVLGATVLTAKIPTKLQGVLLQRFSTVAHAQMCDGREFSYVNVLAISADEYALAEQRGISHLGALLKRKGLDLVSKLQRSSVIARTVVVPFTPQPRLLSGERNNGINSFPEA